MAKLNTFGINSLNDIEADVGGGFKPIPPGDYKALVLEAEMKTTKAGTGQYLACKFQILDEPYSNRYVWANLNVVNQSEKAQNIGRAQFKRLSIAAGSPDLVDTDELLDAEVGLNLAIDRDDPTKNRVMDYFSTSGEKLAHSVAIPQQAATSTAKTQPWKK